MTTYSVYDTAKGLQLLDRVPAEVVIRKMKMLESTFWRCVGQNLMYRQRYEIIPCTDELAKIAPIPAVNFDAFAEEWAKACAAVGKRFGWCVRWLEVDG